MIGLEGGALAQPHYPQDRADHPSTRGKDGSRHQQGHVAPDARGEQRREGHEQCHDIAREDQHVTTSFQEWSLAYPPLHFSADWIKSSLERV
jgi:hypothetical protein